MARSIEIKKSNAGLGGFLPRAVPSGPRGHSGRERLKLMRSLLAPLRAMFSRMQERKRRRRDERDLRDLPDRVLHDLGIGRSEILACMRQGRDIDSSGDGSGA